MKALVGAFNQEKALVGVRDCTTGCEPMDRFATLTFILYVRCRCPHDRSYECQASADVTVYGGMLGPRMCAVGKLSGFYNK